MNNDLGRENWNKFCQQINARSYRDEREYEGALSLLFGLCYGWDVVEQEALPIGNHNKVRLDISLKMRGETRIIVEVKSPEVTVGADEINQLSSYLKIAKVSYGLLIGREITIIHNNQRSSKEPIALVKIPFDVDSSDGIKLSEALDANSFGSGTKLNNFCSELLKRLDVKREASAVVDLLTSEDGEKIIIDALSNSLADKYSVRSIELAMRELAIIKRGQTIVEDKTINSEVAKRVKRHPSLPTTFSMLNIPIGSTLESTFDSRTYRVASNNTIMRDDGAEATASKFAKDALGGSRNGYEYFKYNGKLLVSLRREIDDAYYSR